MSIIKTCKQTPAVSSETFFTGSGANFDWRSAADLKADERFRVAGMVLTTPTLSIGENDQKVSITL